MKKRIALRLRRIAAQLDPQPPAWHVAGNTFTGSSSSGITIVHTR